MLNMAGSESFPFKWFFLNEKGFPMCVIARVFRKTRDGQVVQLQQGVIIGAQARAAVAHELPEGEEVPALAPIKKKPIRLVQFGDTVDSYASCVMHRGRRACRVPSLVR